MNKVIQVILTIITMVAPQLKKEDSKVGIKETAEAITGFNEIGIVCAEKFKDGVQFTDFTSMYSELKDDEDFKAKLEAAWDKHQQIPAEMADIDTGEALELVAVQVEYVPKYIDALKKA